MRFLIFIACILCSTNAYPMEYLAAPFKWVYGGASYMFGSKTYLEIEIESYLKTIIIPWDKITTHGKLESFLQTGIEAHLNDKAKSSPSFLAYLATLAILNQDKLVQKIENNVNDFVTKELAKRKDLSEDFVLIDQEETK